MTIRNGVSRFLKQKRNILTRTHGTVTLSLTLIMKLKTAAGHHSAMRLALALWVIWTHTLHLSNPHLQLEREIPL